MGVRSLADFPDPPPSGSNLFEEMLSGGFGEMRNMTHTPHFLTDDIFLKMEKQITTTTHNGKNDSN